MFVNEIVFAGFQTKGRTRMSDVQCYSMHCSFHLCFYTQKNMIVTKNNIYKGKQPSAFYTDRCNVFY